MNTSHYINEEELLGKAIALLTRKFGSLETTRFLSSISNRTIDSVERHRRWQSKLKKKTFFKEVFQQKGS
jgi:hypothetical protein